MASFPQPTSGIGPLDPAPGGPGFAAGSGPHPASSTSSEGREFDLQREISGTIEGQVQRLIEQARHDTESKVKLDLKQIRDAMLAMDARLDHLLEQLDGLEPPKAAEPPLDAETVGNLLSKIEQQWGQEIRTLKQELHQTILAHNHNADLIKHHKDTIDALRERCAKMQNNNVKTSEIQQQLQKLDTRLKQQQKQRKLEPLFERLAALEQRVAAAAQGAAWRYPGIPPVVPPGMPAPPGVLPSMMPGMGTAVAGMPGKGAGAKATPKPIDKAAYRCPTDEEVQARLSQLSQAGPGGGAEAMVTAPGGGGAASASSAALEDEDA